MKPQVVFIGTSASVPTHARFSPAVLVCSFRTCVLLDVGEAAQINLWRTGVDPMKISIIGVTHVHGDHYYGLVPLIDTMNMRISSQGIQNKHTVRVIGPRDVCSLFRDTLSDYDEVEHQYAIKIECIDAKALFSNRNSIQTSNGEITLTPVAVDHGSIESYGYIIKVRICEKAENYVTIFYSGDGVCDDRCHGVVKEFKPCVVIHEATFIDYESDRVKARQTFHATVGDAALLAYSIAARMLIITHISLRYRADWIRDYISRARRIFSGDIYIADDLSTVPLDVISC